MKRILFFLIAFSACITSISANPPQNDDIISNFRQLSLQQLSDSANYYYKKNSADTALYFYNLIINHPVKETDLQQMKPVIDAYIKSAIIYRNFCDYRTAYELNIKALILCEKTNIESYKPSIYNNVGNIYAYFKKYDLAKLYYQKTLLLVQNSVKKQDSVTNFYVLNNLGDLELENGKLDSAYYYLNQALQKCKLHNNAGIDAIHNGLATLYQKKKQYDSAYYYFRLALDGAKKNNKIERVTENLSGLGKFFFEINKNDSALFYLNLSNTIAVENNFLGILADNYLQLSQIEESKRNTAKAFEHYKTYSNLKDSIFNIDKFGDINNLQRTYEVSKTNQQIEQLTIEQHIKERTIYYQKILWMVTIGVLILVSIVSFVIFLQKRKLNIAYKILFEKNIEILDKQYNTFQNDQKKYQKRVLSHNVQDELLKKILTVMENTTIICDNEFTLDKLADMVQANHADVSQVINSSIKQNFRSFLNRYRIREAQRFFSENDTEKYTIEHIAQQVGFKSRNSFSNAFKEITGVTPNFYLKSIIACPSL
jgi:YesN/AraC family two-component response regulator